MRACVLVGPILLAACNIVSTDRPLFEASPSNSQQLKSGVWSYQVPCKAGDERECGGWETLEVSAGEIRFEPGKSTPVPTLLDRVPYVLVPGRPSVMQLNFKVPSQTDSNLHDSYLYFAIEPTSNDADGRITGGKLWPIECGPPPTPGNQVFFALNGENSDGERSVTRQPLPGMSIAAGKCIALHQSAVQNAAMVSRGWFGEPIQVQWGKVDGKPLAPRVSWLIGSWQNARGPLATVLDVVRASDGSVVGKFRTPDGLKLEGGLTGWKVVEERGETIFYASFASGRTARYIQLPPNEDLDFINLNEPEIKRVSLIRERHELLFRLSQSRSMAQYRFSVREVVDE